MVDPASAARMVAHRTRQGIRPDHEHLLALLPALDAIAADTKEDRSITYGRAFRAVRESLKSAATCGMCEPGACFCLDRALARAALAITDARAATQREAGWAAYERARDRAFVDAGAIYDDERPKAALDAAVKGLLGG